MSPEGVACKSPINFANADWYKAVSGSSTRITGGLSPGTCALANEKDRAYFSPADSLSKGIKPVFPVFSVLNPMVIAVRLERMPPYRGPKLVPIWFQP